MAAASSKRANAIKPAKHERIVVRVAAEERVEVVVKDGAQVAKMPGAAKAEVHAAKVRDRAVKDADRAARGKALPDAVVIKPAVAKVVAHEVRVVRTGKPADVAKVDRADKPVVLREDVVRVAADKAVLRVVAKVVVDRAAAVPRVAVDRAVAVPRVAVADVAKPTPIPL